MVNILFLNTYMHHKNLESLLKYNHSFDVVNHSNLDSINLSKYDVIYSPSTPIDVKKYTNKKFIFGPHFSVFPEKHQMNIIRGNNLIYIQPSDWARDVWRNNPICHGIRIETLPFCVNTDKFNESKPITTRNEVFIYYKSRHPLELNILHNFMTSNNIPYKLFSYNTRYLEQDYLNCLKNAKYGIWFGRHESQGFALEEALSCNVPLLVWNTTSMKQEYPSNYPDIPATTIPYWDERCGEYFYLPEELPAAFNKFIQKVETYKPREYILENLTTEKCNQLLDDIISKI